MLSSLQESDFRLQTSNDFFFAKCKTMPVDFFFFGGGGGVVKEIYYGICASR